MYIAEIRDMLLPDWSNNNNTTKREYTIREEKGTGIVIGGLTEILVKNEEEMQRTLITGSSSRTTSK